MGYFLLNAIAFAIILQKKKSPSIHLSLRNHFANITFEEEIRIRYEVNVWVAFSPRFNSREISQNISTGGLRKPPW